MAEKSPDKTLIFIANLYKRSLRITGGKALRPREVESRTFLTNFETEGGLKELANSNKEALRDIATISVSHPLLKYYIATAKEINAAKSEKIENIKKLLDNISVECPLDLKEEYNNSFEKKLEKIEPFLKDKSPEEYKINIFYNTTDNDERTTFFNNLLKSSINRLQLKEICSILRLKISPFNSEEDNVGIVVSKRVGKPRGEVLYFVKHSEQQLTVINGCCLWYVKEKDNNDSVPQSSSLSIKELIFLYIDFYYLRWRFQDLWEKCLQTATFSSIEEAQEFLSLGINSPVYIVEAPKKSVILGENGVIKYDYITPFGMQTTNTQDESIPCPVKIDSPYTKLGNKIIFTPKEIKPYKISAKSEDVYLYEERSLKKLDSFIEIEVEDNGLTTGIRLELTEDSTTWRKSSDSESKYAAEARCGQKISFKAIATPNVGGKHDDTKDPILCYIENAKNEKVFHTESFQGEYTPKELGTLTIRAKTNVSGHECEKVINVLPDANEIDLDIRTTDKAKIIGEAAHDEKASYFIEGKGKKRVTKIRCFEGTGFHIQYRGIYSANVAQKVWNEECQCEFQNSSGAKWNSPSSFTLCAPGSYTLKTTLRDNPSVSYCVNFEIIVDQSQKAQKWLMATCGIGLLTTLCWYGLNLVTFTLYCLCPLYAIHIGKKKEFYPAIREECLLGLPILSVLFILKALYEELF